MRISAHEIVGTFLSAGFVLLWIGNGYLWYHVCTNGILGHSEDVFGWISTNVLLCSSFSGLFTLTYLILASRFLAYLKKRDAKADGDGKEEGRNEN